MKEIAKISEAEWRVCQVLWRESPLMTSEVVSRLAVSAEWNPSTIKTMLIRLVKKGVLGYRRLGRERQYFPKFGEEECIESHTRSFIGRVFNGTVVAMAAAFIKSHRFTDEEIAELKAVLEEERQKNRKNIAAQSSGSQPRAKNPRVKT